jgi:hypothetical protein
MLEGMAHALLVQEIQVTSRFRVGRMVTSGAAVLQQSEALKDCPLSSVEGARIADRIVVVAVEPMYLL